MRAIFSKELFPRGTPSSGEIALYLACPQYFLYILQTPGQSFFPLRDDMKFLLQLRHNLFWRGYTGVLERIRERGGIVNPDKIPEIVEDSYSTAIRELNLELSGLSENFGEKFEGFSSRTYEHFGDFLNKLLEYRNFVMMGRESYKRRLIKLAEENYGSDNPKYRIIGVDRWGELLGYEDITARPNLIVAHKNPDNVKLIKLRGGAFTEPYLNNWFYIDQAKLAMDYYLFREDPLSFERVMKLFDLPVETEWDKTEVGNILPDRLKIIGANMEIRTFNASEFKEDLEKARAELEECLEKNTPWYEVEHREETCPRKNHPKTLNEIKA